MRLFNMKTMSTGGRFYEWLYDLPFGESLVRGMARIFGKIAFYNPPFQFKHEETIGGVKTHLERLCSEIGIPISVTKVEDDRLEFIVHECPYAFRHAGQQGVCDAVMDLDREVFRLCGAQLTIEESVVKGAEECLVSLKMI